MSARRGWKVWLAGVALATAFGAMPAAAQEQEVSIDDVVRAVVEGGPTATALRSQVRVADAEIDLAGVYSNPRFSYVGMGRFDGSANAINGTQHQLWVDVPILFGQHDARRDVATAMANAAHAELDVALLALELEARRLYLELALATARAARIETSRADLARLAALVTGRAAAGAQSDYDRARFALAVAQLEADLADARADAVTASAALATLAGRPGWRPRPVDSLATSTLAGPRPVDELPVVVAARRRLEAADRDVARAERERIPEIALGLGAYLTTDGDSGSAYVGLSVPLPVFDTGEAAVRRAEAARAAARDALDAVSRQAEIALEGALAVLAERRAVLQAFDDAALARSDEILPMAEAAYRLGVSEVFELLDAFSARHALELTRLELVAAVVEAELAVRAGAAGL